MTLIADLLDRDPRGERLVNNGQARLAGSEDEAREELRTFVCEGRYAEGIAKVLEAFCRDLDNTSQQAAWVSRILWQRQVASPEDAGVPVAQRCLPGRHDAASSW